VLAYATVQGMFLRLDQALGASLLANVGVLALSIAGMGLAATVTRDLESLFWSGFLGACVGVACLAARRRLYFGFVGFSGMHETRALLPFAVIGLFGWISGYGMNAVIGRTLEIEAVAKYTFLFTISSLAHLVASSMNAVWAPRFYDLFNSGRHDELNRKNTIFFAVQAYVVGATGVLAVLGMTVLSGHSERLRFYAEDGLELGLLFISYVIYVAFYQVVSYYHVTGNASRLMRVQIISGTAGLALWIALIFILGVFGVFLGCAVFALVRSYMLYVDARRDWRISPTWMPILLSATAVVMVAIW
jgi:O-antigen/teichoic acid export membrane protein